MAKSPAAAKKPGPVPQEATPARGASRTGETVTVACKMPHGIVIRGFRSAMRSVPVMGGGVRDEKYFEPDGREVTILGNARPVGGEFRTRVVMGFALTQGVPKDLWEEWLASNKSMPAVRNGLIFALGSTSEVAEEARNRGKLRSNLEPLNPNGDPRRPRPLNARVGNVTTNDEASHDFEQIDEEA